MIFIQVCLKGNEKLVLINVYNCFESAKTVYQTMILLVADLINGTTTIECGGQVKLSNFLKALGGLFLLDLVKVETAELPVTQIRQIVVVTC